MTPEPPIDYAESQVRCAECGIARWGHAVVLRHPFTLQPPLWPDLESDQQLAWLEPENTGRRDHV